MALVGGQQPTGTESRVVCLEEKKCQQNSQASHTAKLNSLQSIYYASNQIRVLEYLTMQYRPACLAAHYFEDLIT